MSALPVPTEDQEQRALVQYLNLKGYKHFRVPNETYTKSWSQKAKNKALGVVPGVPDIFVIVNGQLIAIEMKRQKGSTTTPEQKAWIAALNDAGVPAKVCKGVKSAIDFVESGAVPLRSPAIVTKAGAFFTDKQDMERFAKAYIESDETNQLDTELF